MIVDLLQVFISTSEQGNWWDVSPHWADPTSVEKKTKDGLKWGFGIVFKLRMGDVCYPSNQRKINDWQWLKRIWFPLPFFSIAIGWWGFYIGFKDFRADPNHAYLGVQDGERLLTPAFRFTTERAM